MLIFYCLRLFLTMMIVMMQQLPLLIIMSYRVCAGKMMLILYFLLNAQRTSITVCARENFGSSGSNNRTLGQLIVSGVVIRSRNK